MNAKALGPNINLMSGPFAYPRKGGFHGQLPEQPTHPPARSAPQAQDSRHAPMPWPMREARTQLHWHRNPNRPHHPRSRRRHRRASQPRRHMRSLPRAKDPAGGTARPGPVLAQATPGPSRRTPTRLVLLRAATTPWGSPPRPSERTERIGPPIVYGFRTFCRSSHKNTSGCPLAGQEPLGLVQRGRAGLDTCTGFEDLRKMNVQVIGVIRNA